MTLKGLALSSATPYRQHPAVVAYARHVNPTFIDLLNVLGYGRVFTRAQDVWLWDHDGKRYLDCLASFGAANLGHNHPRLIARLEQFFKTDALNCFHVGPSPYMADLAQALAGLAGEPLEITLFSNSGAEAVEAGMKLALVATRRTKIVYCDGAFHGTSLGTLVVMGDDRRRKALEPSVVNSRAIPFGDLAALEAALSKRDVAAFLVEPIQAEGGVILPPPGYLKQAQALCARHGAYLILDEVQTGIGRCGKMFAYQAEDMTPDILVLAKSLGGGIAAIGATLTSREIYRKAFGTMECFDSHGATFAGNSLACVAALETLQIMHDEKLAANSAARGEQLLSGLQKKLAGHPFVKNIRGRGLLAAVEIGPTASGWANNLAPSLVSLVSKKVFGQWISLKLLERGIVCQPAANRWDILKVEPALTIREAEVEQFIDTIGSILHEYQSLPVLLADVAKRVTGIT